MDYNSYGHELKTARERSGMSLQAVADALHLDPRLIEAIEGEDAKVLPAPAYVRGYIRAYAQLVRCEPDTLIARYNVQAKSDPDLVASVHLVAASKQERDARLMWAGTAIVLSLIMVVVGGWLLMENLLLDTPDTALTSSSGVIADSSSLNSPVVADPLQQADPVLHEPRGETPDAVEPADVASGNGSLPAAQPQPQTPAASATPVPTPVAPAAQEPRVAPPVTAPVQEKPAPAEEKPAAPEKPVIKDARIGDDRLSMVLDGISWIEVLDANGARLVYGLFDAQTQSLSVRGQAPFDVTIGDANHVDVSVNGQFVNSEPYIRSNNSARFSVESPAQPQ
ncbi:MAG TPA: RodZ domain-containing protein [Gammaproteobacteria bacterium]|nr:RodZ domain-containing protein [Gammaproteobacteria bacterium]